MLALLLGTHLWYPPGAPPLRCDFLTVMAVLIQAGMLAGGLETREETRVILLFHVAGTAMEVFKTAAGSWIHPEPSVLHIGDVPLFSGFMYASVGSYIARAWRTFDFRFTRHPPVPAVAALAAAIYVNFFAHHSVRDMRLLLFGRTWLHHRIWRAHRRMPALVGFGLVTLFIWFAENIGTYSAPGPIPARPAPGCRLG